MKNPNHAAKTGDFEFAALSEAVNYRRAIISEFAPFLIGGILEIGAGIGQISEAIVHLPGINRLVAVEPDHRFHQDFRERLPGVRLVEGTAGDLATSETFDAAVLVNVLEHIEHDLAELTHLHAILKPSCGHLCLLVPARQEIYSDLDAHFGHYRRYSRTELRNKLETAGFAIRKIHYFNFVGYFAWLLRFRLMRGMCFEINQVRLFDRHIFPCSHAIESRLCRPPIGQSVIAIAQAC